MEYCKRCAYPANTKPDIIFDDQGVCSGCRLIESRPSIDWKEREKWLKALLEEHKARAKEEGRIYDCIIPVSGGKDSHYQTYLMKEVYGMNPLLVTYNHIFNTKLGIRNLTNLVSQFGCDLIRFTSNPHSVKKISRYALKKMGDVTWHYHAGIMTFPIQIAIKYNIPLMIWGEEGFSELTGMYNQDDMVEFTKKKRQEHSMRGFEPIDILEDEDAVEEGITYRDLAPFFYPPDDQIEALGLRGIYLSNYISWNAKSQTEKMIREYGFETAQKRDRTFNIYDKLEDLHANGVHDYLKYLKFGYGRATDDASTEIRHGRMTREEGVEMVMKYDAVRPADLDTYLNFIDMDESRFMEIVAPLRDPEIWECDGDNGEWHTKDHIGNHVHDAGVEAARVPQTDHNRGFIKSEFKPDTIRTITENEAGKSLNDQDFYVYL